MLTKSFPLIAAIALLMFALLSTAQAVQLRNFSTGRLGNKRFAVELGMDLQTLIDAELFEARLRNPNMGKVVILTADTIDEHLATGKHFVNFYNPWCVHCYRLSPTWDELAKALVREQSVTISKIDCAQFRSACQKYQIKGYPTLLWIEDGKKIENYVQGRDLHDLVAYVNRCLRHDEL